MRISRLYVEASLQPGNSLTLSPEASHYLATVLRLGVDDSVLLFNGADGEFRATLTAAQKKKVTVLIGTQQRPAEAPPLTIHLGVGLSRGERMDFVMQKATELGVSAITPLYCEFGEVRFKQQNRLDNKMRHWRQVVINACEQSGRLTVPVISEPVTALDWISSQTAGCKLILDPEGGKRFTELELGDEIALFSGPEGGFSDTEVNQAQAAGFSNVVMGPRVLRTETAPLAALAILQTLRGDF